MAWKCYPLAAALTHLALAPFVKCARGWENVPQHDPYLVVSNHSSFMDGVILADTWAWHGRRPLHMISNQEPFAHWLFGWVLRSGRSICLDRSNRDGGQAAMERSLAWLACGEPVGIFPEGHINGGRAMRRPRPGAAFLALATGVPVLPVGIRNSAQTLPLGAPRPRVGRRIEIEIGAPIAFDNAPEQYQNGTAAARVDLVREITRRIVGAVAPLAAQTPPRGWE